MQLFQKEKSFSELFPTFLKCSSNFKYFKKKLTVIAFVFPKLRTLKMLLNKCPKSPALEDALTSNMVNVPKHC